ncbi:MAG: hypothetical protein ABI977_22300 [Acidobacteriota bacterium]
MFESGLRESRYGKLTIQTGFFLPCWLFKVTVQNAGMQQDQYLAIDAMTGELDLRQLDQPPGEEEYDEVESDQFGATRLDEAEALAILQERVRRMVYQQGFFRLADLSITGKLVDRFYILYHVAFYVRKNRARLEVIDSLRGQFEGAKLRDLIENWASETAQQKENERAKSRSQ